MIPSKNLPLLMSLVYWGYNNGLPDGSFAPTFNKDGTHTTHCNQFLNYVLKGFGYLDMLEKTANEMVDFMADNKNGWITVSDDVAQAHANSGIVVVAARKNPEGHGHVALVIPGVLERSGSYCRPVPKSVSIGKDVYIGKSISFAFKADAQPVYYCLAGMI